MKKPVLAANIRKVSSVFHQAGVAPTTTPGAVIHMLSPSQSGMSHPPRKSVAMSAEAVRMAECFALKYIGNLVEEFSAWWVATSSDTASGMSKGSRFVSAKAETTKRKN